MSNIFWPRRPDLCNKDGRDCRKLDEHMFRFKNADGEEVGWLRVCGDYGFKLTGIEVRKIKTLGHRAIGTTQVFYNDVKVPASAILGQVDQGWEAVDSYLWYERLCLSAARTGAAPACRAARG